MVVVWVVVDEMFGKGLNGEGGLLWDMYILVQQVVKIWIDFGGQFIYLVYINMVWFDFEDVNCLDVWVDEFGKEVGLKFMGGRLVIYY